MSKSKQFRNQPGASIVEVTIAMVVFIIIMVGGLNYYFLPQATIGRQKTKRLVVSAARDKMEKLIALQYAGVTPDSNETNTPVTVGNTTINRTTTITEVDDAADGLGGADADSDTVDYKSITVAMSWNDGSAKSLSFSTTVSIDDSSWVAGGDSNFVSNILFTSTRDGNSEIYVMDADGSNQTNLTNNGAVDADPEWSRDGTKIVFASSRDDPNYEIYVMDADGSNPTRITNDASFDLEPTWSPDGSKIAFTTTRDGVTFEIYMMDADGSNPTRLTTDALGHDVNERWSPDGSKIVFASNRDDPNYEIYVMDAVDGDLDGNGDNMTRLTTDAGLDLRPNWSPDGSKIIFGSEQVEPGNVDIYVMDADGANKTRLISDAGFDTRPSWSADGSKIAFSTDRDGNEEVYVMDADGSNQTRLTNEAALDYQPVFVPGASVSALPGWSRKCELVIQASQVPDNLTNFPVLVTEATLPTEMFDADGTYFALNGGGDIRFSSDQNGTFLLPCEIVTFTTDNNPALGKAEIWVKVPTVSSSSNTSIWVWYNKAGATQPPAAAVYGSESVWDANYMGVWHLKESGNGTADEFADATGNANHGQGGGVSDPSQQLTTVVTNVPVGWSSSRQNLVFYNGSNFFLLYTTGGGDIWYKSSSDNVTWSAATSLVSNQHLTELGFDIYLVNDSKLDLVYLQPSWNPWALTASISGTTITPGTASQVSGAGATEHITIARTGTGGGDRVYVGFLESNGKTNFGSAVQAGDITGSTTWSVSAQAASAINFTFVPYQDTDKVLGIYSEDPGGSNNDGIFSRTVTPSGVSSELELDDTNQYVNGSNAVRISDTDFRVIRRPVALGMTEWKFDGTAWSFVDWNTESSSPSLFYDRISGDLYAFAISFPFGTDDVLRNKKPSGSAWDDTVVVDDGEATLHTLPITQMHEPPYGSSRTTPLQLVWAYRVANGSNFDLIVGNLSLTGGGGVGPTQVTTGKIGNAQDFDGVNNYIEIPNSATLENVQEGDYTLEAWFSPDQIPPGVDPDNDARYGIVEKPGYHMGIVHWLNRYWIEHFLDPVPTWAGAVGLTTTWVPGSFRHVVGVVSKTYAVSAIYVDGQGDGLNDFPGGIGTTAWEYNQNPWRIGIGGPGAATFRWAADGKIDEVRISSVARSSGWIAASYNNQDDPSTFVIEGAPKGP